jgi:hypothetical protein
MYTIPGSPLQIRACLTVPRPTPPNLFTLCTSQALPHTPVPSGAPSITSASGAAFVIEVISLHSKTVEIQFSGRIAHGFVSFPVMPSPWSGMVSPAYTSWSNPYRYPIPLTWKAAGRETILCEFLRYRVYTNWQSWCRLPLCVDINVL